MNYDENLVIAEEVMEAESDFNTALYPGEIDNSKWYFMVTIVKCLFIIISILRIIANNTYATRMVK